MQHTVERASRKRSTVAAKTICGRDATPTHSSHKTTAHRRVSRESDVSELGSVPVSLLEPRILCRKIANTGVSRDRAATKWRWSASAENQNYVQWRCRSGDAAGRRTHRRDLHAHAHELKLLPEPAGQRARQQVGGQVPAIEKAHAMRENQTGSHTTSKKRNTIAATLRAVRGRRPNGHTVHAQSCVGVRQQTMKTLCAVAMPRAGARTDGTFTHRLTSAVVRPSELGSEPDSKLEDAFLRPQDRESTPAGKYVSTNRAAAQQARNETPWRQHCVQRHGQDDSAQG